MSGFGISPFGLSAFGSPTPPSLASAVASSTNSVDVTFTAEPEATSDSSPGDALNPASWVITRLDTGFSFTVVTVTRVQGTTFRINTVESFGAYTVTHNVSAASVLAPSGAPLSSPTNLNFFGVLAETMLTAETQAAQRNFTTTDVQNLPTPTIDSQLAGTLVMTSGGDYASVSGDAFVRKLIMRRLITPTGGFFHLPNYGLGLTPKTLIPSNDLLKLKTAIEQQCLQEPEVSAATASLTIDTANQILTVRLVVQTRTSGQSLQIGFKMTPNGVLQL